MTNIIPLIDVSEQTKPLKEQDLYASREKIYVRKIEGVFQQIRKYSLSFLMLMYFSFAWIRIDDKPLILFDLMERKFYLFGAVFWPQDFALLAFALIICAFGLFFITTIYGRVWCGYSCPQTAWSLIFIWLEEFFEGSRNQRIKLDNQPHSIAKSAKKVAKHGSWIIIALVTAITFVGYFYPIRTLMSELLTISVNSGWLIFWIAFFTVATYVNAGWLREQVCIYMCPYARFQSVMYNENTQLVGYDEQRGEPRGSRSRSHTEHGLGDCVDCQLCVQVCPVGIDIRDGLQYECIGCALCIDACDSVMSKLNYPKGLIRYASETEFKLGKTDRKLDWRTLAYGAALVLATAVFFSLLITRPMVELSAERDRGPLYQETGLGKIRNSYTLQVVNKGEVRKEFQISAEGPFPITVSESVFEVAAGSIVSIPISLEVEPSSVEKSKNDISFVIAASSNGNVLRKASTFFSPVY